MKDWVTWFLVIAGWLFVNYTNNRRESRKEARAAVDQAKKDVHSIARAAIDYFGDTASKASDDIKNSLELLEVELERLSGYSGSPLANRFLEFHDRCTGADFESAVRVAHNSTSAVVLGITFARNKLIQQLELHFRDKYSGGKI